MHMLKTLAVANYRSINKLVVPLDRLNLVTGPNGSGKSNLYRALRLLAETAQGGVINALAREGGLDSTFWAGPETISRRMRNGEVPVEPMVRQGVKRLRLGFAGEDFSYAISLGLPEKNPVVFFPGPGSEEGMHLGWPPLPPGQPAGAAFRADGAST